MDTCEILDVKYDAIHHTIDKISKEAPPLPPRQVFGGFMWKLSSLFTKPIYYVNTLCNKSDEPSVMENWFTFN